MDSTNSMLLTILDRVRFYLDETDVDAKYTDAYIVNHIISTAMVDVLARLHLTHGADMVLSFPITLEVDVEKYVLPPCVQEVVQLIQNDSDGHFVRDIEPIDRMVSGTGWRVEGNPGNLALVVTGILPASLDVEVQYISNGDVRPHMGTGTIDEDADGNHVFTLDLTPTLGLVDRRPGAYVGQVLRLLPDSPFPVEERTILSHDFVWSASSPSYTVTVEKNFTHAGPPTAASTSSAGDDTFTYEIAPAGSSALYEAIALLAAMKLGTSRKITGEHMARLQQQYKMALKTYGDNTTNINTRRGHHYIKNTIDNPNTFRRI